MYDNVFERIEQKYLISKKEKDELFKKINNYIEEDKYFDTTICNIYFDTENNDLIINSIEKPIYKDKIRLRSYGVPGLNSSVFLEIKNKYKHIVGKRRIKLTLNEFYDYVDNGIYDKNNQIMRELDYYIKYYKLVPKIFIAYDRKSYISKGNNIRMTIDSNLRSRRNNLKLELGDDGTKYFSDDTYILEIKALGSMPLWLVKTLSELKIYPSSFSKYGSIYRKEFINYVE
ncbi:MAG: polyphosphate polymerase domain-containing protein [Bacilli bacterium]